MDLTWAIEDVARTSDEAIVRSRYGERNRVWLTFLLVFFGLVSFIQVMSNQRTNEMLDVFAGVGNFALCAFGVFFLRYARPQSVPSDSFTWRAGARLREYTSAAALSFVAIQFPLSLWITGTRHDDWFGWAIMFPFFMLGFRMMPVELVLLHGYLLAGSFVMSFIAPIANRSNLIPFYISLAVINVLACATEWFFSRRMRRQLVSEWTVRRSSAREQIRMRDELRYARELQISMLPECAPHMAWADICSISIPATEVGGDYYDYFVEEERIALVCGDVAGHGMASGLVLSALRSGFTLLRDSLHDPAAVLLRLHDLVAQTTRRRMLVTVSVVLIDHAGQRATIASAGHPPVILRRASGSVETIDLYAPPLGVRLPVNIPQRTIAIAPGDTFILHSDGIYETRSASGEDYGMDRLVDVVRNHDEPGAESLRNAILRDVDTFRGTPEATDDITIVVCVVSC